MNRFPLWARALAVIVLIAVVVLFSRLLLWADRLDVGL